MQFIFSYNFLLNCGESSLLHQRYRAVHAGEACSRIDTRFAGTIFALTLHKQGQYYFRMPRIIAILFEEDPDASYIAVELDTVDEPEVLFMKGPGFEKQMGPFPLPYAEATFSRWNYSRVVNPPHVAINDVRALRNALRNLKPDSSGMAVYAPGHA
jgi:hypothetical protein